ncbi:uncharacterized protein C11orf97 homolog [Perognathus longimembris pacificus]|uniref:uncharacterized protein C11orf97 homolog n=1 Tax=Perognathus longimembris pacificus TaxID=214514 RepID=UPI00201A1389|nr:uncharacterized protein C11orf97 homolog [Perognathus longimembris pacificus]
MATRGASSSLAACRAKAWCPKAPKNPSGMRLQEAQVVTEAVAAPEAGSSGEQCRQPAGLGCWISGQSNGPQEPHKQWKKFLYCEPHKRIKEVLEEELYIKRDECHIKNPPAVALEGIWSIKRNLPVGGLTQGLPSRNTLLPQAKYYSRHGGLRSKMLCF